MRVESEPQRRRNRPSQYNLADRVASFARDVGWGRVVVSRIVTTRSAFGPWLGISGHGVPSEKEASGGARGAVNSGWAQFWRRQFVASFEYGSARAGSTQGRRTMLA